MRDFRKFAAVAIALLLVFLIGFLRAAHAGEWKASVPVGAWCDSYEPIEKMIALENTVSVKAALAVMRKSLKNGRCIIMPPGTGAMFRPEEQVRKFAHFMGKPWAVIRGSLLSDDGSGIQVFIMLPESKLHLFKTGPQPGNIKYREA